MAQKTFKEIKPLHIEDTFSTSGIQNITSALYASDDGNITEHLFLFHGESGSGKSLAARIIAADILKLEGQERENFISKLELESEYSGHFEAINGSAHNKVDDARIFDDKVKEIENAGGFSNIPYVFIIDEVDTFTPEAMKAYLTTLDKIKDGKIPDVYVFMTTSRVKKLTSEFLRRFLVVEFNPFQRFEHADRFITYQLEMNGFDPDLINEQTRRDIYYAAEGSPGFIVNYIKQYLLSGSIPEDPERGDAGIRDILKVILKISTEISKGKIESIPVLDQTLARVHAKSGNWESVRIGLMSAIHYNMIGHSEDGKLNTEKLRILNEYLKILIPFTVEARLGKYELLARCITMAEARYKIVSSRLKVKSRKNETEREYSSKDRAEDPDDYPRKRRKARSDY